MLIGFRAEFHSYMTCRQFVFQFVEFFVQDERSHSVIHITIGHAVTAVEQGRWINETQIKTNLAGLLDYTYNPVSVDLNIPKKDLTFKGYRRKNGDV